MFRLESDQVELVSQFAQNNTAQTGKLGHVAPPVSHRHGDVSVNVQVRGLVDDPQVVLLVDDELLPPMVDRWYRLLLVVSLAFPQPHYVD